MPTLRRRPAARVVTKITLADGEQVLVGKKPRRLNALMKKDNTEKKLNAFRQIVGMWEGKDTSFFDK
jgi:hypothetical protein